MAATLNIGPLTFKPIDLAATTAICIRFREDSFVASFGDSAKFHEADGKGAERYIEWLRAKISKDPASAVHVWKGAEIIGQMELGVFKNEPGVGNVNLYYLVPEKRGQGYARYLDEYAVHYLKGLGLVKTKLSVSPTNACAVRFYEKQGWRDLGPRPGHPEVHWMEKSLE